MSKRESLAGKYFRTTETYIADGWGMYVSGSAGRVVASVGTNNYLIQMCKGPNFTKRVVPSEFFIETCAVIFDTFEEMKAKESR